MLRCPSAPHQPPAGQNWFRLHHSYSASIMYLPTTLQGQRAVCHQQGGTGQQAWHMHHAQGSSHVAADYHAVKQADGEAGQPATARRLQHIPSITQLRPYTSLYIPPRRMDPAPTAGLVPSSMPTAGAARGGSSLQSLQFRILYYDPQPVLRCSGRQAGMHVTRRPGSVCLTGFMTVHELACSAHPRAGRPRDFEYKHQQCSTVAQLLAGGAAAVPLPPTSLSAIACRGRQAASRVAPSLAAAPVCPGGLLRPFSFLPSLPHSSWSARLPPLRDHSIAEHSCASGGCGASAILPQHPHQPLLLDCAQAPAPEQPAAHPHRHLPPGPERVRTRACMQRRLACMLPSQLACCTCCQSVLIWQRHVEAACRWECEGLS